MHQAGLVFTDTLSRARSSISKLQQNLINFLEKGEVIPIQINEFMQCYSDISSISGKIKGEDDSAIKLFCEFIDYYIVEFIFKESSEKDGGEEYLDFLIRKWNNFKIYLSVIEKIFFKIDKFKKNISLMCLAFELLKKNCFDKIAGKINQVLFSFLEMERDDHYVPQNKILAVINVNSSFRL